MGNNSATGGYLTPSAGPVFPGGLTLTQFIQSFIAGVSGFNGTLVRPRWQVEEPKQPDITVDWMAFGIQTVNPDQFAYIAMADGDSSTSILQRQTLLEIQIAVYGPNAIDNVMALQDGFLINQNLEVLSSVNMGYRSITPAVRGPDLVNGRWVERLETTLYLTWQVQRSYAILSLEAVAGTIHTVISGNTTDFPINVEDQS